MFVFFFVSTCTECRWMMWKWSYNSYIGYSPYALYTLCRLYHHVSLVCWNVSQTLFPCTKYEGISSIRNLRPEPRLPFPDPYFWPFAAHYCSRDGNITQDLQGIKCLLTLCSIVTQLSCSTVVWDAGISVYDLCSWRALLMQTGLLVLSWLVMLGLSGRLCTSSVMHF